MPQSGNRNSESTLILVFYYFLNLSHLGRRMIHAEQATQLVLGFSAELHCCQDVLLVACGLFFSFTQHTRKAT